jgi:tetratricopeptide (TPR) repeat protein
MASNSALHAMAFKYVTLYESFDQQSVYTVTIQISHDINNEGELSLYFRSNGDPLYVISFTIIPGYVIGLSDRHTLLISRMQGRKGKFQEIRLATKEMNEISPQAVLVAALQGIAKAIDCQHIGGVCAISQVSYDEQNADLYERVYDRFFSDIGATDAKNGFYVLSMSAPEKPITLVKPGHRLRTRLKRKNKADLSESVFLAWQKFVCANGDEEVSPLLEPARYVRAREWFGAGSLAGDMRLHVPNNAAEGRDWVRARGLAEEMRLRFPDDPTGYQIGVAAARELRKFDEAFAIIAEGKARFPLEAWPVAEGAWIARARGDADEAMRLAAELRTRSPNDPAGYQVGLFAARELRKFDEAFAISADAIARFPTEAWPVTEAAWTARARGDAGAAMRLAAELRGRFPDNPAGYQIGAAAAREMRRFDEAFAIIADGIARFPAEVWPVAEGAWIARARGDADEATRLAAELRTRSPNDPAGYQVGAATAREMRRFDEASAIIADGMARFPAEAWPMVEAGWIAGARGDAGEATRLATELRGRFPDNPAGYQIGAAAAREMRRFDEAYAVIADGMARFPAEAWPVMEAAWTARARGDASEATRLAAELHSRFPDNPIVHQLGR